jgi:transposase
VVALLTLPRFKSNPKVVWNFGRPPEHDLRRIMEAILYVDRTEIPWRCLPHGPEPPTASSNALPDS